MTSIFISAGEASGDTYGAQLIDALGRGGHSSGFFGMGGARMQASGFEVITDARRVAVVGLIEVVRHLPSIYAEFRRLLRAIDQRRPQAAVLIDFPDFNLRLAKQLHKRGIPVIYFVSPQLWAWRKGRIQEVRKYVKKMLVIFPFEEKFYRDQGVDAEYVGHPLTDLPLPAGITSERPSIALLPGSRKQEVLRNLPEMIRAAEILGSDYHYVLPIASTLHRDWVEAQLHRAGPRPEIQIELVSDARVAMASARASIVASGTATVEAALAGNPFIVVYRVAPLTWTLGRPMVDLKNFAMVNLIAGKTVVPELIQKDFTAEKIVGELKKLLTDGPERTQMLEELVQVRTLLQPESASRSAADRAAQAVIKVMVSRNK